jgi:hypothetical protein
MEVELLRVEEVFDLTSLGLVFAPSIPLPRTGKFQSFSSDVTVRPPVSPSFIVNASFQLTHFNIRDPALGADRRWQIVMCLGKIAKNLVPTGSVIWCDEGTKLRLIQAD